MAIINFTGSNTTLADQMVQYSNNLSIKEAYNSALQRAVQTLQVKVNNLKYKLAQQVTQNTS